MDGVQSREEGVKGEYTDPRKGSCSMVDLLLRAAALGLTVAAAVVMGTAKQTTTVLVQVSANLPAINVPVAAKWHYLSAFVFFAVANVIACAYAAISLLMVFFNKGGRSAAVGFLITIADIIIVALLFSGSGAATAVGIIGREGNSHVQWNKVCNVFGGFCDRVAAAIVLSLLGALAFVLLASMAVLRLRKRIN